MTFEKTYEIKNNKLTINLPDEFKSKKRVRVIIEDVDDDRKRKLKLLKGAAKDPLFLSDIKEITEDFQYSDKEALWGTIV